jgi:hypothetical protein
LTKPQNLNGKEECGVSLSVESALTTSKDSSPNGRNMEEKA